MENENIEQLEEVLEEEVIVDDPKVEETQPEDFSNVETDIKDIKHFLEDSHIDYSEGFEEISEVLKETQKQNEEIKGLLVDINNNIDTTENTNSEVIQEDYSEVLNKIDDNSTDISILLAGGIAIAMSIVIIYFLYKLIAPFTR